MITYINNVLNCVAKIQFHQKTVVSFLLIFCCGFGSQAQKKFSTNSGVVNFTSNAKLELIKASSKEIQGVVDLTTGQFAFIVKVQSFEGFNSNLQQQHFNERYLESDKFYNATFSGKIMEPASDFNKDGIYDVNAKGVLIIHGVKQMRIIPCKMQIEKTTLKIKSQFVIPLADHNITIPSIVNEKIATEVILDLNISMIQKP